MDQNRESPGGTGRFDRSGYMLYFEKTSDTTLSRSYISPKQHFDNIEDFKVTEQTELFQNY